MKGQIFRIIALVFALFITFGITSCRIFPQETSARAEALQAVSKKWDGKIKYKTTEGKLSAVVDNKADIVSPKFIPVKAGERYILSGSFKSLGKTPSKVYYGFICYDKGKRQIDTFHSNVILDSATTLAEACKKGDKELMIKANNKWQKGNYAVAFNVKDNFSDLPNREVVYKIIKVVPRCENMKVQLSKALKKDYPAGTKVRMHTSAHGTYIYTAVCGAVIPKSWKAYEGSVTLGKPGQIGWQYLRPGTAFVKVIILPNYNKGNDERLAFKDLKLVIE